MIDPVVAFDKLAQFETAEEIREFFQHEQIQAQPQSANSCAITRWMKDQTEIEVLSTNHSGVKWFYNGSQSHNWDTQIPLTAAMDEFIDNFDNGKYPELVDPRWYFLIGYDPFWNNA